MRRDPLKSVPLFYRELGEARGDGKVAPVLLLHGLFGSGDNLGTLARRLASDRRVVMIDLRNHGQSPHVDTMSLAEMAADVRDLQIRLGLPACDVVAHSLGGKVAMQLAMTTPDAVRRLVIVDIAPVAYPPGHDDVFAALAAVDLNAIGSRRDAEAMMTPFIPEPMLRQFLLKSLYRDATGYRWRFNLPALLANYSDVRAAPTGVPFMGPALFVKGGLSDYLAPQYQSQMHALFPLALLCEIEGAGHWVHGEKPEPFNQIVEDFLTTGMGRSS